MQFLAKDDIAAPIAHVFAQITDFAAFERQAMRRGADVRRIDTLPRAGIGNVWSVRFLFRGRERDLRAEVTGFDPPNGLTLTAVAQNLSVVTVIELVALSRTHTRLTIRLDLAASGLATRLLLQSLKLAKGGLTRKFEARVSEFAQDVQARYQRRPGQGQGQGQG